METNAVETQEQTVQEAQVQEQPVVEEEAPKDPKPEEQYYSQAELDSRIARAISDANKKWRERQSKTSDERITALEMELQKRDNQDYARSKAKEMGIDSSLASLLYSNSEEETDSKAIILSRYLKDAVTSGVEARLKECKPIDLQQSDPKPSNAVNRRKSLAELQQEFNAHNK